MHGWAQSSQAWLPQLTDESLHKYRLVAVDLRGHGASDVPADGYDDSWVWADELAAVLDFAAASAILVGWSHGGLVIADYLRAHGTARVIGIVLVGAIIEIGRGRPGGSIGPAMAAALPAALSDDPDIEVPALVEFSRAQATKVVPGALGQSLLGASLSTPPFVRKSLFKLDVGSADVLAAIDVPALIVHGTEDRIVNFWTAEYAAGKIPGAVTRWLSDVGHLPFAEVAPEFSGALRQFVDDVTA